MLVYANPNPTCLFPNPLGSVTPFVRWIEDYPLPDGLKMPSHISSYDGKGDPDNFLYLFEGAIRMQKWLMPGKKNNEGGRPSEEAPRGNGSQNVNISLLLAAHIERSENGQPLQSSLTSAYGGHALPNNIRGNLPPNTYGLPFVNSDEKPPYRGSFKNLPQGGHVPSTFTNANILPKNGFTHPANIPSNSYLFYTQPIYAFPNMLVYANPNPTCLFPNPLGSVTPFVRWIEDYPLPDGLKMPSHISSYDGKGDPDNFLYLFEGAIRMQKGPEKTREQRLPGSIEEGKE
nr:hypothetical protein [Tanacetum cinerariifolium]